MAAEMVADWLSNAINSEIAASAPMMEVPMVDLKRCPCGQDPKDVSIYNPNQGGKWASVVPDCCGEWMVEFRLNYEDPDSSEAKQLAVEAWNNAPRTVIVSRDDY